MERLIAALDHPLGATRRLVAGLLGRTGDPRAVEALSAAVREAIARRDWELLDGVVEGLADSGSREAAEALEVIAEQGYAPARRRAREALGQLGRAG